MRSQRAAARCGWSSASTTVSAAASIRSSACARRTGVLRTYPDSVDLAHRVPLVRLVVTEPEEEHAVERLGHRLNLGLDGFDGIHSSPLLPRIDAGDRDDGCSKRERAGLRSQNRHSVITPSASVCRTRCGSTPARNQ